MAQNEKRSGINDHKFPKEANAVPKWPQVLPKANDDKNSGFVAGSASPGHTVHTQYTSSTGAAGVGTPNDHNSIVAILFHPRFVGCMSAAHRMPQTLNFLRGPDFSAELHDFLFKPI